MAEVRCAVHGVGKGVWVSRGIGTHIREQRFAKRQERIHEVHNIFRTSSQFLLAFSSEIGVDPQNSSEHIDVNTISAAVYDRLVEGCHNSCTICAGEFRDRHRERQWFHVRMQRLGNGLFQVSVDEYPIIELISDDQEQLFERCAEALAQLSQTEEDFPAPAYGSWIDYVRSCFREMGMVSFSDLPIGERCIRKDFPAVLEKVDHEFCRRMDSYYEFVNVGPEEIVWHHVYSEGQRESFAARRAYSGNPDLHL